MIVKIAILFFLIASITISHAGEELWFESLSKSLSDDLKSKSTRRNASKNKNDEQFYRCLNNGEEVVVTKPCSEFGFSDYNDEYKTTKNLQKAEKGWGSFRRTDVACRDFEVFERHIDAMMKKDYKQADNEIRSQGCRLIEWKTKIRGPIEKRKDKIGSEYVKVIHNGDEIWTLEAGVEFGQE